MKLFDSFVAALKSLGANMMRSVLTTLGIIIGVSARVHGRGQVENRSTIDETSSATEQRSTVYSAGVRILAPGWMLRLDRVTKTVEVVSSLRKTSRVP